MSSQDTACQSASSASAFATPTNDHPSYHQSPPSPLSASAPPTPHSLSRNHSTQWISSFSRKIRSASHSALSSLPNTPNIIPSQRTSFIKDATELSKNKAILSIAIRKGLFVFSSVHAVVSAALIALALLRRARKPKTPTPFNRSKRPSPSALALAIIQTLSLPSTARLAGWLGLYSSLWTLSYAFLRKHKGRLAPWNAFLAGAFSGISLFAQTKADRREIAPNVFCRGLYSMLMCYPLCRLKYAEMLLFAASNAQIAIAYLLYPSTLPQWYFNWISRVGRLNFRFVDLNRQMDRALVSPAVDLRTAHARLLGRDSRPRTWHNEIRIQRWLNSPSPQARRGAPCALNHSGYDSCLAFNFHMVLHTMAKMGPTYAILHLVPALIFRWKVLLKTPITFMISMFKKTIASALFIGTFVSVVQNCFCVPSQLYERFGITVRGSGLYGLIGFCTGLSLLWEEPKRRGELALYCAPKALYSLWAVLKARKLVPSIIWGDVLVGSVGCGMLMHCFVHRADRMPALARGMIGQLVDPHTPDRTKKIKKEAEKTRQQANVG